MQFPVMIPFGPWQIHPHALFEPLGYFLAARLFWHLRKQGADNVSMQNRFWAIAGAAAGGALGSKLLFLFENPALTFQHWINPAYYIGGKTVVGGLLGGLMGVEFVKRRVGEGRSTGDLFVLPLILGIAVGRVGCFLTGLPDNTHGGPTALPWGVDFGDGIARHPAQLYEIAFLALLGAWVVWRRRMEHRSGDLFRGFMVGYLLFRLLVDALKPYPSPYFGLGAIQAACLAGLLYYARDIRRVFVVKGVARHG